MYRFPSYTDAPFLALAMVLGLAGSSFCDAYVFTHEAMSTPFAITLHGSNEHDLRRIAKEAFDAIDDLERRISTWIPDSETTHLTNHGWKKAVRVSTDLFELLAISQRIHAKTDGAFDCTMGPLLELWGFYAGKGRIPTDGEIAEARRRVGSDRLTLHSAESSVRLDTQGMRLDFGAIAKGFALDKAARILRNRGISQALLHAGTSSVLAIGAPPGEEGWKVNIRHPYNEGEVIDRVVIRNEALSTSGCYGALPRAEDASLCDILDPRTGRPVVGMLSASVIVPTAAEADGLSTAFLVLGDDRARAYCSENLGVHAVIIPEPRTGAPKPEHVPFNP